MCCKLPKRCRDFSTSSTSGSKAIQLTSNSCPCTKSAPRPAGRASSSAPRQPDGSGLLVHGLDSGSARPGRNSPGKGPKAFALPAQPASCSTALPWDCSGMQNY